MSHYKRSKFPRIIKTLQVSSKKRAGRPLGHSSKNKAFRGNRQRGHFLFSSTELHFSYMLHIFTKKKQLMFSRIKGTQLKKVVNFAIDHSPSVQV